MKKLLLVLALFGFMLSPAFAIQYGTSTNKTMLQYPINATGIKIGATAAVIATPGVPITGILAIGGGSGGTVTIYDSNSSSVTANEVVFETILAANGAAYYDLSNAPINTLSGIYVSSTSTSGVIVYNGAGTTNL